MNGLHGLPLALPVLGLACAASGVIPPDPGSFLADAAAVQAAMDALPQRTDGAFAVRLDAGRVAFLGGDSVPLGGGAWAHNTVTVLDGEGAHLARPQLPGANPYQVVPDDPDGSYRWLGPGFVVGGTLYAVTSRVRSTPGSWPYFASVGQDWALIDVTDEPRFLRLAPGPSSMWGAEVTWGTGVSYNPVSGVVTVFGVSRDAVDGWTGHDVYAARTRLPKLGDPFGWRWWDGASWSSDPSAPAPVLTAAEDGGTEPSFTAWQDDDGWHLTSRLGGNQGAPSMVRWSTPVLGDPWTAQVLAEVPAGAYGVTEAQAVGVLGSGTGSGATRSPVWA